MMASRAAMLLNPRGYRQEQVEAHSNGSAVTSSPSRKPSINSRHSPTIAAPAGTRPMAHQLLNPSFQQRVLSNSKPKSKHNPSSITRSSSRSSSISTQVSVPNDTGVVSAEMKSGSPTLGGQLEFEFTNGDLKTADDVMEKQIKRPLSLGEIKMDNEHRSLIEQMYQVERRQDQPQKRFKIIDNTEEKLKTQKARFEISGNSGLGDYMKQDKGHSEVSTPDIVDLTLESASQSGSINGGDEELQFTGSNDLRTQRVCYGKVEGAMIQAHLVPKPSAQNPFADSPSQWPPIRLDVRHSAAQNKKIEVADTEHVVFGAIDAKTASALVPLLDSPALKVDITARLDMRKKSQDEVVWKETSALYRASVNLYGLRKDAELVGKHLGQHNVWLGTPAMVEQGVPVFNPHAERRRNQPAFGPAAAARSRPPATYEVRTAEEVNDAVMKMFDQLKATENIPEMEPSPVIVTPLLPHQKQALWFMTEKEKPRKFGPREEDNNSLWRMDRGANGKKRYREIISGMVLNEEPPQHPGGLLADVMGLGKTLSILSLVIASLPESRAWADKVPHPDLIRDCPGIRNTKTTLLVSPLSAVNNWVTQIKEHLQEGALSYYVFHGSSRTTSVDELSKYDMVITTYSIVLSELSGRGTKRGVSPLTKMNMFRIVLDEAHIIREQSAAQTQAILRLNGERRWSVTGTPIQNRLEDLVSVTKFLRIYPYNARSNFSAHILSRFKLGDPTVLASLRVLVDSFTLRRIKEKVDLPDRDNKIVKLTFSEKEKQLHEFFRRESNVMMNVIANESKSKMGGRMYHHVLKAMMILRQVSAHGKELLDKEDRERIKGISVHDAIDLEEGDQGDQGQVTDKKAYEMFSLMQESSADVCAKCGKTLEAPTTETGAVDKTAIMAVMLPCFDVLCTECFSPWKQVFDTQPESPSQEIRCQVCDGWIRVVYSAITAGGFEAYQETQAQAKHNRKQAKTLGEYEGPHTKTKALIAHLQDTEEENKKLRAENQRPIKSVVFSAWTSHLDLIEIALKDNLDTQFTRLDGTMSLAARGKALDELRDNDDITVLLATIGAGGVGLNLTAASRVYVMEPQYNPAAVAQAVDRVHRLGQTREVKILQFVMRDSIEEKIYELAMKKQQLADMSMNRGKLDKREVQEARMREYRGLFK